MRYPTLSVGHVEEIVSGLVNGSNPSCDAAAMWRGDGETIDFDVLDAILERLRLDLESLGTDPSLTADKEPFEGRVAVAIYPFLDALPIEVLDDPGFWRYLSVSRFWGFVQWREAAAISRGNVGTYTDGRRNTEQIPLRLYLRTKAVAATGELALAMDLQKCTDFWRSHVIRVRTASAPALAAAFAEMQNGEDRLPTAKLRPYARRLNRTWTNVQLGLYDPDRAKAMIAELRE